MFGIMISRIRNLYIYIAKYDHWINYVDAIAKLKKVREEQSILRRFYQFEHKSVATPNLIWEND